MTNFYFSRIQIFVCNNLLNSNGSSVSTGSLSRIQVFVWSNLNSNEASISTMKQEFKSLSGIVSTGSISRI